MTHVIGPMILDGHQKTAGYAKMLVEDIPAERFSERPHPTINHPTFCIGHLALYPNAALTTMGRGDLVVEQPGWEELFSFKATCEDDTGQYPGKDELVSTFLERCEVISSVLPEISDETFSAALPDNHMMKSRMSTVGDVVNFLLLAHPMLHLGQISSWRRAVGLGEVMNRR